MSNSIENIQSAISEIIQRKRINKSYSYQELSEATEKYKVKLSAATIQKIENGIITPKSEQLFVLMLVLEISLIVDHTNII